MLHLPLLFDFRSREIPCSLDSSVFFLRSQRIQLNELNLCVVTVTIYTHTHTSYIKFRNSNRKFYKKCHTADGSTHTHLFHTHAYIYASILLSNESYKNTSITEECPYRKLIEQETSSHQCTCTEPVLIVCLRTYVHKWMLQYSIQLKRLLQSESY